MQPSDRERFAVLMNGMASTFRQEPTEALLTGYWIGLRDLPIEAIESAVGRGLRECRFMPCVAELREMAGDIRPEDRAIQAWVCFERAVTEHGGYASVDFEDSLINATVRALGGWERCCGMPAEEFDRWLPREFQRVYSSFARSGVDPELRLPLGGICSRQNAGLGVATSREPARIAAPSTMRPAARAGRTQTAPLDACVLRIGLMPEGIK